MVGSNSRIILSNEKSELQRISIVLFLRKKNTEYSEHVQISVNLCINSNTAPIKKKGMRLITYRR